MANVNIRRDVADPFYRYKMERLQSKVEGKGNGIKTVVVNLSNVAQQLARPPSYVIKYFGFELGAQTNIDPKDDRWIINGSHEASKLQDYLDGFIKKFVLCQACQNPETVISLKDGDIQMDCKACGKITRADPRQKLSGFILKSVPKKGKKDKSTKKADRKARKEAEKNGTLDDDDADANGHSPGDSASDGADPEENGDVGVDGGSDDELTRKINAEAKELDAPQADIKWRSDFSEEAVRKRAQDAAALPDDLKEKLAIEEAEDEDKESNVYDDLGKWIEQKAKDEGGIANVKDVDIYLHAKELGIETKHKTPAVLAQCIFTDNIAKEIKVRASMLKKMITSDRHEKAFLGGIERFVGIDKPALIPSVSAILLQIYQNDLISEDVLQSWDGKASKKYVDLATSKKVRKSAETFLNWLKNAESDESDDDE